MKFLNLYPIDDIYTCEILDSSMFFKNDCIYWCDNNNPLKTDFEKFQGTIICASQLRWRPVVKKSRQRPERQTGDGSVSGNQVHKNDKE